MLGFDDQVVIVTGSGSPHGIGKALALRFAELGGAVVVADMDEDGAISVANEIESKGWKAFPVKLDVFDEKSVNDMVESVAARFGRIDVLCNNAGITQSIGTFDMSKDDFMRIVNINLVGTFLCSKAVAPVMARRNYGRIVNTSSVSAKNGGGVFGGSHYCAAKAGIIGFSRAFAKEVVKDGITVNCVCPGAIATDIRKGISDEKEKSLATGNPMGRIGTALEVADAIVFLASREAGYITAEDLNINGGAYIG